MQTQISPMLAVADGAAASDFYKAAFDAKVLWQLGGGRWSFDWRRAVLSRSRIASTRHAWTILRGFHDREDRTLRG